MQQQQQDVSRQVERILSSPLFSQSSRMSRFLRFVVEESLAGREDSLKESTIGAAVFDRGPEYDPAIDPIVRVEARRLRSKLRAYYAAHASEPVIAMPTGGYRPEFRVNGARDASARRVFVQPFAALTSLREDESLAEGLAQEIIHLLTSVPGLRVTASADSGDLLVVEGSVQRSCERVRVFVNLLRKPAQDYIWSGRFEDAVPSAFPFQERVAEAVGQALAAGSFRHGN